MPLGYAANLTMATMRGEKLPNVTIARNSTDTSIGCFLVYIKVDSAFPLPGNVRASGRIITAGLSMDNKTVLMTAVFSEMNILQGSFSIRNISTFPVVADSDIITGKRQLMIVYTDIDVNSGSDTLLTVGISHDQITAELKKFQTMKSFDSGVALKENAWIITVDDNHTLSNAFDDIYVVFGGGQYIEVSNSKSDMVQLTMIGATMTPQCKMNPTSGWALWQDFGAGSQPTDVDIGQVLLTYHSTCDGNAKVAVSTGVYARSFGKEIALILGQ
jgi:hypothetical protein